MYEDSALIRWHMGPLASPEPNSAVTFNVGKMVNGLETGGYPVRG